MKETHDAVEKFECKTCGKHFALRWRLNKHLRNHENQNIRKCHYFNNQEKCPFEEIGCMFDHSYSGACKYGNTCNKVLCSFQHNNENSHHNQQLSEEEKEFDLYVKTKFRKVFDYFYEKQKHVPCYFCDYNTESHILKYAADEISDHMDEKHEDIIAAFDPDSSKFENDLHKEFMKFLVIG